MVEIALNAEWSRKLIDRFSYLVKFIFKSKELQFAWGFWSGVGMSIGPDLDQTGPRTKKLGINLVGNGEPGTRPTSLIPVPTGSILQVLKN